METYEQRLAAWEAELREKYSDDDRKKMAKSGEAMADGSYPIADQEDLENAIHAVGRGNADHDAIRKHIIARAKALGHSDMIPDNWNADGSLKEEDSSSVAAERRRKERHRKVPLYPEVRFYNGTVVEVRERSDTNEIVIEGTPIVYNQPYVVADMFGEFTERMDPSVGRTLMARNVDVRFLFNHDGLPLARTAAGTMEFEDTLAGLKMRATLDARQQLANDLMIAIQRGDVSQMSCGFIVARDEWSEDWDERTIYEFADMLDVSAVTYPASPTTSIEVAKRMILAAPLQTRARLRLLDVVTRAGKPLSAASAAKVVTALTALQDLAESIHPDDLPSTVAEEDDGSEGGGNIESDAGIVYPDGSGQRAQPTSSDSGISYDLKRLKAQIAAVKAEQLADPDNGVDPDDEQVMACINAAEAAIDKAIVAQSKDARTESRLTVSKLRLLNEAGRAS